MVKTVNQHADTVLMARHVTTLMAPVRMAAKKDTRICPCARNLQLKVENISLYVLEYSVLSCSCIVAYMCTCIYGCLCAFQLARVGNTVKTVNQHADTVLMMNHVTTLMAPVLMAANQATSTCLSARNRNL
jgi:hypothetical protein